MRLFRLDMTSAAYFQAFIVALAPVVGAFLFGLLAMGFWCKRSSHVALIAAQRALLRVEHRRVQSGDALCCWCFRPRGDEHTHTCERRIALAAIRRAL